jgi:ankyrin repeat protein
LNVARYLVDEAGADVNLSASDGKTALHFACCEGHLSIVQYLMTCSGIKKEHHSLTAIHCAIRYGHLQVVQYFDKMIAKVIFSRGMNALHVSCLYGHIAVVEFLLSSTLIDIKDTCKNGKTAVHYAILHDHLQKYVLLKMWLDTLLG